MRALLLLSCASLIVAVARGAREPGTTVNLEADCYYNNKLVSKLAEEAKSMFLQLRAREVPSKCMDADAAIVCAQVGSSKSGMERCTWCQRGTSAKCLGCKFYEKYIALGYQCAPDILQCGGELRPETDDAEGGGSDVGVPEGAEWNQALLCKHLAPEFMAVKVDTVLQADEPASAFIDKCVDVLGEVCLPECRTLSELYENAASPGMEVTGRPGNVGPNALQPYGTDGKAFRTPINKELSPTDRRLDYSMTEKDCLQCLEGLDCLPDCLALGTCTELPAKAHEKLQEQIGSGSGSLLRRRRRRRR